MTIIILKVVNMAETRANAGKKKYLNVGIM